MFALLAAAAIGLLPNPTPLPVSTAAAPVVWQAVTLGESTTAVIDRLGAPKSRHKSLSGTYLLEYPALGGAGTLLLTDGGGSINGIRLSVADASALRGSPVDPYGIALGDTADRLSELRGQPQRYDDEGGGEFTSYYGRPSEVRWAYGLRDGKIFAIGVVLPYRIVRATGVAAAVPTPRPSDAPTPPPPDASELDRAVKVTPDDVAADNQFEYAFVQKTQCGTADHWTPIGETIFNTKRRNFSKIDAVCTSTGAKRSFYFDITLVFGRADR
jgi:hypothetical protein